MTVYWCDSWPTWPPPPGHGRPGRPARRGGRLGGAGPRRDRPAGPCWCAGPRCCPSSASSAATWPARPGSEYERARHRPRHAAAGRAATGRPAARAHVHPVDQGHEGHDENISFDAAVDLVGRRRPRRPRDLCLDALPAGRRPGRRSRLHRWPTPSSSSAHRRRAGRCATRCVTPDSSRLWPADQVVPGHQPAGLRQAAPAGLAGRPAGWDKRRRPPPLPDEVVAGHLEPLRGRLRADHRAPLADWYGADRR